MNTTTKKYNCTTPHNGPKPARHTHQPPIWACTYHGLTQFRIYSLGPPARFIETANTCTQSIVNSFIRSLFFLSGSCGRLFDSCSPSKLGWLRLAAERDGVRIPSRRCGKSKRKNLGEVVWPTTFSEQTSFHSMLPKTPTLSEQIGYVCRVWLGDLDLVAIWRRVCAEG